MRIAVYFTPAPEEPMADLGARWLGRDIESGHSVEQIEVEGVSRDVFASSTRLAQRYGFHATVKAPFRPRPEFSVADLEDAFVAVLATLEPVEISALRISRFGRFLAIVPQMRSAEMEALALSVVAELEPFRAPLSPDELIRRRLHGLSQSERAMLDRYGYPYVGSEFRFHFTLTDPLDDDSEAIRTAAQNHFGPVLGQPLQVGQLSLVVEPQSSAPFCILRRLPLGANRIR